jgi:DUF1680 family protein
VARTLASAGNYLYSTGEQDLWLHLYAGNTAAVEIGGTTVTVKQETLYPWDGAVKLSFELSQPQTFALHLRVPGWCRQYQLAVNGVPQDVQADAGGYLAIQRVWQTGDSVTYTMDMPVEAMWANPQVRQLEGRVAIQRGPIVYCLEGVDHDSIILDRISVNASEIASFKVEYRPEFLGGSTVITGQGKVIDATNWGNALYQNQAPAHKDIAITAVPYCVWDNRESGEMRVWLRAG